MYTPPIQLLWSPYNLQNWLFSHTNFLFRTKDWQLHKRLMVESLKLDCYYFKCKHLNYSQLAMISNASMIFKNKCLQQCQIQNGESKPWIQPIHERLRIPGSPVSVYSGYSEHKKANWAIFSYHWVKVLLSFKGIVLTMEIMELTKPESFKALWWECLFHTWPRNMLLCLE